MELDKFRDVDLVIDHVNRNYVEKQFVSQNDNDGRTLTVQVTNGGAIGEIPGLMMNLRWSNLASGLTDLSAFELIDKNTSKFQIKYPKNMLNPGRVLASIQIIQNGQVAHSRQFEIIVQQLAGEAKGIIQKAEYSTLVQTLSDANKFRTDIDVLDSKKADKSFVDAQFATIVSGAPKGTYTTVDALKAAYPRGADGIFLVLEDGNWYYWNSTVSQWVSGGIYQAEQKKFSILPRDIDLWHTFKVSTKIGDPYVFNNTENTIENTENYFETSVASYGSYTTLLEVPIRGRETTLYLRGTINYRISVIEYDVDKTVIQSSDWANTIDWRLSSECRYIVFAIKKYDETPMLLSELNYIDCDVQSDVLTKELTERLNTNSSEKFGEWIQGMYTSSTNGSPISGVLYSNYRMSNMITVNPSSHYMLSAELESKYRYAIDLFDSEKKKIMSCGWTEKRKELSIRTPANCRYMVVTIANIGDSKTFKDEQRLELNMNLRRQSDLSNFDQFFGPKNGDKFSIKSTWLNLSIGTGVDGKVNTPVVDNRLLTRIDLEANKIYTITAKSPANYRFNFVQATTNRDFIFESYWQVGGARIKTEVVGYLYICVYKLDPETNEVTTISVEDAGNFELSIIESSSLNPLLENRFKKKVICHRGASLIEPENTLPAFEKCGRLGIWGCEMDIRYTIDGYAVIIHDETVDRTTNGTGKISEMTLAEIRSLTIDFGENIESYTDLKVPTLREAIDVCRVYGTTPILDFGLLVDNPDDALLKKMLNDITELGILNDCVIVCQTTWIASSIRAKNSTTPIVMAYSGLIGAEVEARRLFKFHNSYCGGWYLSTTSDEQLKELYEIGKRDYNLQFYMMTNDKAEAKKYLEIGCDFICSDDPAILNFD